MYRAIADDIARGTLAPGDRMPVERALCERFGVSRATVRRALESLASEGLVESHSRRGSFVASGPLSEPPNVLLGFSAMAAARGFAVTNTVLSAQVRPATMDEAELLQIAPGADVFELKRLRKVEGKPFMTEVDRLPLARTAGVEQVDYSSNASLHETLTSLGVPPARADYTAEAIAADADQARLLEVAPGAPLLSIDDSTFDENGVPILHSAQVYRGDRYRLRTTLHSSQAARAT